MKLSITTKLFLAIFVTSRASVLAMGLAARANLAHGFLGYLNHQALERTQALKAPLAAAYAAHGSWDFLRDKPHAWFRILRSTAIDAEHPTPPAADLLGANLRIGLFDAGRQPVIGAPGDRGGGNEQWLPIRAHGHVVGWLMLATLQKATSAADVRFEHRQFRAIWIITALALLLSALLSLWLARTLLAPVKRVAHATHRLAAGHYETRVKAGQTDEIGQLGRDFNHLADTLERNEQMRRTMMADISHELRTPLSILRGELEALEDGVRPLTAESLRSLTGEVALLTQLVADLYDLSLSDAGALAYRKIEVDLVAVLHDVLGAFSTRLAAVQIEVVLPAYPVILLADEARLAQLFNNLLENSLRYTAAPGRLRLALTVADPLVILLEDSAPGVGASDRARLFERFYRTQASRSRRTGGAGLGLAICRNIVEAHDGSIRAADSGLGGLRIVVVLPRNLG